MHQDVRNGDIWHCQQKRHKGWVVVARHDTPTKVRIEGVRGATHLRKTQQWIDKQTFLMNFTRA